MIQTVCQIVQAIASVAGVAATVFIAWTVRRGTKRLARIEHDRAIKNAWIAIDTIALSDDRNLEAADLLINPDTEGDSLEERRRRWLCFMFMNPMGATFRGFDGGLFDSSAAAPYENELYPLASNEVFFAMVKKYAFEPGFVELCERLRRRTDFS
ncbi:hypothetical protein ACIRVF_31430 [Kitasatospora sp. NPDC101157]|uniref:hypothetical protein n=1 Tax=Kitasatospora sp. NPDC101157 TaxID=3364098 RepID=UPI0038277B9A